jgi:hypothetical protein
MIKKGDFSATIKNGNDTLYIKPDGQVYLKDPHNAKSPNIKYGLVKDIKPAAPVYDPTQAHHDLIIAEAKKVHSKLTPEHFTVGNTSYKIKPNGDIYIDEGDDWFIYDSIHPMGPK